MTTWIDSTAITTTWIEPTNISDGYDRYIAYDADVIYDSTDSTIATNIWVDNVGETTTWTEDIT